MSSRSLIFKATADNNDAVGGSTLRSLAHNTRLGAEECALMRGLLEKRIRKTSVDVKYKALRCVVYLSEYGEQAFRAQWQRDNAVLREHTSYRGRADALRGEAPNQRVRDEAKKAMKAIFSTAQPARMAQPQSSVGGGGGGKFVGFGSDGGGGSGAGAAAGASTSLGGGGFGSEPATSGALAFSSGGSRFAGMGSDGSYRPGTGEFKSNARIASGVGELWVCIVQNGVNIRVRPSVSAQKAGKNLRWHEHVRMVDEFKGRGEHWIRHSRGWSCAMAQGGRVLMQKRGVGQYSAPTQNTTVSSGGGFGGGGGGYSAPLVASTPAPTGPTGSTAGAPGFNYSNPYSAGGGQDTPASDQDQDPFSAGGGAGVGPDAAQGGSGGYESKLVDDICKPSGVKLAPRREDLKAFVQRCQTVSLDAVLARLNDKLIDAQLKTKIKAMYVIEGLCAASFSAQVMAFFKAQPQRLSALTQSTAGSLRTKAVAVCQALQIGGAGQPQPAQVVPAQQQAAPAQQQQEQEQQPQQTLNIFGLAQPTATTTPAPASQSSGFDFLSGGGAPASGTTQNAGVAAPAPAAQGSAFGFLDAGASTTQPQPQPKATAAPQQGSAFSFLDSTGGADAPAAAPKKAAVDIFDLPSPMESKSGAAAQAAAPSSGLASGMQQMNLTAAIMSGKKLDAVSSLLLTTSSGPTTAARPAQRRAAGGGIEALYAANGSARARKPDVSIDMFMTQSAAPPASQGLDNIVPLVVESPKASKPKPKPRAKTPKSDSFSFVDDLMK